MKTRHDASIYNEGPREEPKRARRVIQPSISSSFNKITSGEISLEKRKEHVESESSSDSGEISIEGSSKFAHESTEEVTAEKDNHLVTAPLHESFSNHFSVATQNQHG